MAKLWNDEDTFVVTEAGQLLRKANEALARVRELHTPIETYFRPACKECSRIASGATGCETFVVVELCKTINALDFDLDYVEVDGETDGAV